MTYRVWKQTEADKIYCTYGDLNLAKKSVRSSVAEGGLDSAWIVDNTGNTIYHCSLDIYGRLSINIDYTEGEKAMNFNNRNKIAEIKAVRAVSDLGLREAKELVESMSSSELAAWVMERAYSFTGELKRKAENYDMVFASNERYLADNAGMRSRIYQLEKENKNLLNQRNTILAMLTKEQILDLYIASQSQTE